jgi:hypothetical protein
MSADLKRQVLLLKIRNAIADKDMCVQCAHRDTNYGGWTKDWKADAQEFSKSIDAWLTELETLPSSTDLVDKVVAAITDCNNSICSLQDMLHHRLQQ